MHYIHCAIGRPAQACAAYTWSYDIARAIDLLYASIKRSVCLAERYNSLRLERARENLSTLPILTDYW